MLRALVVGPDRSGRREVVRRLGECQFDCVEAKDCMAALRFAGDDAIDLIVTEIETRRLSDLPLLQIVQSGGFGKSPPPVIVCSALLHDAPWSPNRGGFEVTLLGRPFTPRAFADALDAAFPVE
jgi:CheY-like chemotaxis protein